MSCNISGCSNEADLFCEICKTSSLFCLKHGKAHQKDLNHPVKVISDDIIDRITKGHLSKKSKIK